MVKKPTEIFKYSITPSNEKFICKQKLENIINSNLILKKEFKQLENVVYYNEDNLDQNQDKDKDKCVKYASIELWFKIEIDTKLFTNKGFSIIEC